MASVMIQVVVASIKAVLFSPPSGRKLHASAAHTPKANSPKTPAAQTAMR